MRLYSSGVASRFAQFSKFVGFLVEQSVVILYDRDQVIDASKMMLKEGTTIVKSRLRNRLTDDDVVHRLVSGLEQNEGLRKDVSDLKRSLAEETYEKEAVQRSANDLRNTVKKLEAEKVENTRQIQEMKQRIGRTFSVDIFGTTIVKISLDQICKQL